MKTQTAFRDEKQPFSRFSGHGKSPEKGLLK